MLQPDVLRRLCRARDLLRAEPDRRVTVRRVAREAGMSVYHFIRLFRAVFGETPYQCRLRARLERARWQLATSDDSVTDVSLDVGFASLGSFSALFARRVGSSPTAYRRRVRSRAPTHGQAGRALTPGCLSLMGASDPQLSRSARRADGARSGPHGEPATSRPVEEP